MRRSDSGGSHLHDTPLPPPLRCRASATLNIMTLVLEFRLNSSLIINSELDGVDQKTPIALLRHLQKRILPFVLEPSAAVWLSEKNPRC